MDDIEGDVERGENVLLAALREFAEETGVHLTGTPAALEEIAQAGGKRVAAFALEGNFDANAIVSNMFDLGWPLRSAKMCSFPRSTERRGLRSNAPEPMCSRASCRCLTNSRSCLN